MRPKTTLKDAGDSEYDFKVFILLTKGSESLKAEVRTAIDSWLKREGLDKRPEFSRIQKGGAE